jgi:hypothetical protein
MKQDRAGKRLMIPERDADEVSYGLWHRPSPWDRQKRRTRGINEENSGNVEERT